MWTNSTSKLNKGPESQSQSPIFLEGMRDREGTELLFGTKCSYASDSESNRSFGDILEPKGICNGAIRNSLKRKITENREKSGLGQIKINDDDPKTYQMSPEEEEKDRKRRESNRKSAKRKEFEEKNWELKSSMTKMEHEKKKILDGLRQFLPEYEIALALQRAIELESHSTREEQPQTNTEDSVEMPTEDNENVDVLTNNGGNYEIPSNSILDKLAMAEPVNEISSVQCPTAIPVINVSDLKKILSLHKGTSNGQIIDFHQHKTGESFLKMLNDTN
ncbi:hypothetical protein MAR_028678 [Mya arenaria]|uniref:BZIP domain-containing protein n=1 Tax=Mya arenaria TaxID=6604 RepID=A0ABY7DFE1_MYAAR|nr:hypothetical protein MAR_028678 [Mya arenaria]